MPDDDLEISFTLDVAIRLASNDGLFLLVRPTGVDDLWRFEILVYTALLITVARQSSGELNHFLFVTILKFSNVSLVKVFRMPSVVVVYGQASVVE